MKTASKDWDSWAIKSALGRKGYSLAQIARDLGIKPPTANNVLRRRYPSVEARIAEVVGVGPEVIWPSRYKNLSRVQDWGNA